jgi:predicted nucleic acid-binding protein
MRHILIDTGAIYAFVVRTDPHHIEAVEFIRQIAESGESLVLLDAVFAEAMTLLKARLGAAMAIRVGTELKTNPFYTWQSLGVDGEAEAWNAFQIYAEKEWTFTECSILATAKRLQADEVFAFDRHFEQMPGLIRLP